MERVRALFEKQHREGRFPGGQLVVRHRGQVVLEHVVGNARGFRAGEEVMPVTPTTRFAVFSASKAVVAIALAMLEERGVIDVNAPVTRYFPEFGANGKEAITVLDVLTHRAGVIMPEFIADPSGWGDVARVKAAMIATKPRFKRGTLAYMPYEYGWILAEVVRGATGRGLDEFVHEEFGMPGLRFGAGGDTIARTYWLGTKKTVVAGNELSATFEAHNNRDDVVNAFIPGAGLVCTAHDLAAFYDALLQGKLVKPETLHRYTSAGISSFDRSNRIPMRMARGFMLGTIPPSIYGWWMTQHCFGHAGAFCTLAYADPTRELAVAIVTNGNAGPNDSLSRFASLGSAIRRAI
jgi:CubicO group peptidase (beta-lactamase class C family)